MVVGWFSWFDKRMGSGRNSGREDKAAGIVSFSEAEVSPDDAEQLTVIREYEGPAVTRTPRPVVDYSHLYWKGESEVAGSPAPALSASPEVVAVAAVDVPVWVERRVYMLWYWPDDGPMWCLEYGPDGCVSSTTSGEAWRDWEDVGLACPAEWLGHWLQIEGRQYKCVDTGVNWWCDDTLCTVGLITQDPIAVETVALVEGG